MPRMTKADEAVLLVLSANRESLTRQQFQTSRGQVFAGDSDGATRGLVRIIKRGCGS